MTVRRHRASPVQVTRNDGTVEVRAAYRRPELLLVLRGGRPRKPRRSTDRANSIRHALWMACGGDGDIPTEKWATYTWAARELARRSGTASDIAERAAAFRLRYPRRRLTPHALLARWSSLDPREPGKTISGGSTRRTVSTEAR